MVSCTAFWPSKYENLASHFLFNRHLRVDIRPCSPLFSFTGIHLEDGFIFSLSNCNFKSFFLVGISLDSGPKCPHSLCRCFSHDLCIIESLCCRCQLCITAATWVIGISSKYKLLVSTNHFAWNTALRVWHSPRLGVQDVLVWIKFCERHCTVFEWMATEMTLWKRVQCVMIITNYKTTSW